MGGCFEQRRQERAKAEAIVCRTCSVSSQTGAQTGRGATVTDGAAKARQRLAGLEWWIENLELFSCGIGALLKTLSKEGSILCTDGLFWYHCREQISRGHIKGGGTAVLQIRHGQVGPAAEQGEEDVIAWRPMQKVKSPLGNKEEGEVKPDSQASGFGEGANDQTGEAWGGVILGEVGKRQAQFQTHWLWDVGVVPVMSWSCPLPRA